MSETHKLKMIRYYQDFINHLKTRDFKYGYRCFQNLKMIRYYQDFINHLKTRDFKYGYRCFQNQDEIFYHLENKKILSRFMIIEYEDQIHIIDGVGERSISICVTVTFEDKTNHQNEFGKKLFGYSHGK